MVIFIETESRVVIDRNWEKRKGAFSWISRVSVLPDEKSPGAWLHKMWMNFTWPKCILTAATAKSLQSCLTLCDPKNGSPPGSLVSGILQARTLGWVAISFSNAWKWKVKAVIQSCPTLSHPKDCSPPGSSTHGNFQARVLEWGANAHLKMAKMVNVMQYVF